MPCLIEGMARKFQAEFQETIKAQRLTLAPGASSSRPSVEFQHALPSHIAAIAPSVDLVVRFVSKFRQADGSEDNIEIALHEALTNAVVHGNQEDPGKHVYVACRCSIDGEVSITIRDEGQGFNSRCIPDPTAPENRMCTQGRGIYLMQTLMDEVCFEEGGAVVRMRKKPNFDSAA